MVAVTKTNQDTPRATGWKIPGAILGGVVLDPGIVYTSADVLMFAGTNTTGLVAMLAATGIAASLRTMSILKPTFLEKYPKITAIAFDDRTPLRAGGLALLVVGGAAVSTGAMLPAAASFLFAAANFRLAESISKKADNQQVNPSPRLTKPSAAEMTAVFIKRPELYLNAGFACAGLMAGGAALFVLPVVGAAFAVGMKNALQEKPEYAGHPKIITATAAAVFAAIGYANGHGLIAAAHAINAAVLVEMERRVTPGGMLQIAKDMAGTVGRLFTGKKPPSLPQKRPVPELQHAQSKPFMDGKQLMFTFKEFSMPQQAAANQNDGVAVAHSVLKTPQAKPPRMAPGA
ncbi:MAG: hypothetical protein ACAH83_02460 [Alphaproteobacteria bacterium]